MIKDYKGEMPKNVTTPEKAKAKKPFYKDWKFWVLTGLMTLFGACSIYGLVLGSQYVKAIERASHIIADAQESKSEGLNKVRREVQRPNGTGNVVQFDFTLARPASSAYISLNGVVSNWADFADYSCFWTYRGDSQTINLTWKYPGASYTLYLEDHFKFSSTAGVSITNPYTLSVASSFSMAGVFYYDGYSAGYDVGFDDGADTMADAQIIKVLLAPDFTGHRIQYTYTLDGAEVGTGYLSNTNQHYQNQVQFSRPAGGQHKAVLNLYSDNDEPIKIAYDTFTGTLGETRYLWYQKSNAYDWSASQWYVPTYWAEARFLVTGYGTYDQGFTEDYFFNLDPQYNDRAKVGAYSEGYDAGYNDAVESGDAFDAGYEQGHEDGKSEGETEGFNRGVAVGSSGSQSLAMMFKTAFQLPFDQLYRFLNFNLLGINFLSLFTALISVSIGIMVIKKVL